MRHTLELYWDFSSPFAYLATTQAERVASAHDAQLIWRPMLLGALFKAIGQAEVPIFSWPEVKRAYFFKDLDRWARHWGVPFRFPEKFPMNTVKALRVYLALPVARQGKFRREVFEAYWAHGRDISDDGVLRELLGNDADQVLARTQESEIKQALFQGTQRAIDAGVFGAPTWVVDGEHMFWGQDRLPLVERALSV